jgi:hypothetical protein
MARSISDITKNYLDKTGMTLRRFADELCSGLSYDGDINVSHVTVINWRDGKTEPGTDFLTLVLLRNHDWKADFALECLAAKRPEVWGPDGGIWQIVKRIPVAVEHTLEAI